MLKHQKVFKVYRLATTCYKVVWPKMPFMHALTTYSADYRITSYSSYSIQVNGTYLKKLRLINYVPVI